MVFYAGQSRTTHSENQMDTECVSIYDYLQMTEYLSTVINGTMVNSYMSLLEEYTLLI
jgi:hypothetical protein